ncbi:ATP-binding cassette domain-containing protein [Ferrimonas sediminicola]|uniref:ATP-binding cassette domain-containing protein n=1 Tax=Ferrimonas sediminicola TaxID=2569538 RepID=A0A4U1BCI1_9GAMM|nr:ATP-binding cassette domain-containing protein [Ferrimonas sediminicola]TKB48397.1 ATP-binding cassette domain-containing protein [Ferrimonas sediminicola]
MIIVKDLAKGFAVPKSGQLTQCKRLDPRLQEGFFNSVQSVSFRVRPGEVLGLLGPNGAGKTTVLRMLSGVLSPDRGSIEINGRHWHQHPERMRRQIGFLSASTSLYERFSVEENLIYFGQLYGLSRAQIANRIHTLSDQLELASFLQRKVVELSLGMKQRAGIARAVIHQPEVIVLDEPTTGLDIMSAQAVLDFILSQKQRNRPVIFSTHKLEEVSLLCDRIAVVMLGRCVFEGSLTEFAGSRDPGALRQAFVACQQRISRSVGRTRGAA